MATNLVSRTPRVVTSPDSTVQTGEVHITGFRLTTTPAVAGACTVQDDNGNTVWKGVTTTNQGSDQTIFPFNSSITLAGHKVSAISGVNAELEIYVI